MHWKLDQKNRKMKRFPGNAAKNFPKPERLPGAAVKYLIGQLGHNPAWVRRLKCVMKLKDKENNIYELRVFDETLTITDGVRVKNYHSLDNHPQLIIYEGWIDKDGDIAFLK